MDSTIDFIQLSSDRELHPSENRPFRKLDPSNYGKVSLSGIEKTALACSRVWFVFWLVDSGSDSFLDSSFDFCFVVDNFFVSSFWLNAVKLSSDSFSNSSSLSVMVRGIKMKKKSNYYVSFNLNL